MNLRPGSLLFGVAPAIIRDCAKQLVERRDPFTIENFCRAIGAPYFEAQAVLRAMIAEGFVALTEDGKQYEQTQLLRQLANASISAGLPRIEADRLLSRVLAAAEKVNQDPERYPYAVQCLAVFGSYLGDKPVLGDLDLAVSLREVVRVTEFPKGQSFREALDRDAAAHNKTFAALRLRSPKLISIHKMQEVLELQTPYRVLFGSIEKR